MAISEKILKAPPSTRFTDDPRDHFGTAYWEGNGTSQSVNGGKFDACADFEHASAHFDIVSPISIASNTDFTYSFWLNFPTVPGTSGFLFGILGQPTNGTDGPMNLNFYGNTDGTAHSIERYFNSTQYYSDNYSTEAKFTYSANTWYHVALVYTGSSSTAQVYHNGSATGSSYVLDTSNGGRTLSNTHCVGMYNPGYYTGSYGFWGKMDQFRIYDVALSSTEVAALYNESYDDSFKLNFPSGKTAKSLYRFNGDIKDIGGTYNGTGSTSMAFTKAVNFTPDVVWVKSRSETGHHSLFDTIRGVSKVLTPNQDGAEIDRTSNSAGVTAFSSGGFTVNDPGGASENYYVNQDGVTYVAWCWNAGGSSATNNDGSVAGTVRANTDAGFSIVQCTSPSSVINFNYGHGLSKAPELVITKTTGIASYWEVIYPDTYGQASGSSSPSDWNRIKLDDNGAPLSNAYMAADGTKIYNGAWSANTALINYCFHSVDGYQKINTYTGNGSANGPLVETGFKPAFLMVKRIDTSANWRIYDDQRSPSNPINKELFPNLNYAEQTFSAVNFYDDGFQLISTDTNSNASGGTFLYLAIAAPLETTTPVLAKSFKPVLFTGRSQNVTGFGFKPDLAWVFNRAAANGNFINDSVRGVTETIWPTTTDAEDNRNVVTGFLSDGVTIGDYASIGTGNNIVYGWKASGSKEILTAGSLDSLASINDEAGFSIVKYTGNATAGATVAHGLSAAPQFIIIKNLDRTGYGWLVYHASRGATKYLVMNTTAAESTQTSIFNDTAPTSTVFTLGSDTFGNYNGDRYIAYCWRSITGYSSFGSYTGNGSSTNAITGLGFQPNWLMIKNTTDSNNDWQIYDSLRGDGMALLANSDNAEADNSSNFGQFDSDGFTVESANDGNNKNGSLYIYMAFKMN